MESFKMNRALRVELVGACATLLACSGAAFAQEKADDFSQPLDKPAAKNKSTKRSGPKVDSGLGAGESRTMIQLSDGEDTYAITISGGDIEAKVNGKVLPAERIRRSKDKVEILDDHGKVLKSFDVSLGDAGLGGGDARPRSRSFRQVQPLEPMQPMQPMQPMEGMAIAMPKVMIGITMGEPSEALAGHLGIKQDEAVLVEKVYEGLPADKAGLKAQDIIVEVDGVRPVTQQTFRETINKHEAGEKVTLKVLRKGEEQKITVELKKFDGEKLGMPGAQGGLGALGGDPQIWRNFDNDQFHDLFKDNPEARKKFEEAMKNAWRANPDAQGGQAWVFGNGPEGQPFKFTPFGGTDAKRLDEMQAQLDRKISELDEKLARVNEQMEKLEKLLSKMSEKGTR